jgi:hypothetical protein
MESKSIDRRRSYNSAKTCWQRPCRHSGLRRIAIYERQGFHTPFSDRISES